MPYALVIIAVHFGYYDLTPWWSRSTEGGPKQNYKLEQMNINEVHLPFPASLIEHSFMISVEGQSNCETQNKNP